VAMNRNHVTNRGIREHGGAITAGP
jgi:hypothetical protein